MKIGFIGAGMIGGGLARLAIAAGHEVLVSNSRDPRTLFSLAGALGEKGKVGSASEAAAFGDIVVVAIPFYAYEALPADALAGKIVLDTMNYFAVRDAQVPEIDSGEATSSEMLARHLPSANVVRAFNAIISHELATDASPAGTPGRRAVPLAGDDAAAKRAVASLIDSLGFDPVDIGPLSEGRRMEAGGQIFNIRLDATGIRQVVAA